MSIPETLMDAIQSYLVPAIPGIGAAALSLYNLYQMRRGAILKLDQFVNFGLHYPLGIQRMKKLPPIKYLYLPILINNSGYKAGYVSDIKVVVQHIDDVKLLPISRRVEFHKEEGSNPLVYTKRDFREVVPQFPVFIPPQEGTLLILECEDEDHEVIPLNENLTVRISIKYGQKKSSIIEMPFKLTSIDLDRSFEEIIWVRAYGVEPEPDSDSFILKELMRDLKKDDRYEYILNHSYFDRSLRFEGKKIAKLNLGSLNLGFIPANINRFSELRELNLNGNRLTTLPEEIGSLKKLEKLIVSKNVLNSLPESIGELKSLKQLILDNNQLKTLPASIGNLSNLEVLIVSSNEFVSLPDSIGNLSNLKILYLDQNEIGNLPKSITNLENLSSFWLSKNRLHTLPSDLGSMKNLTQLSLAQNTELSHIPESIGELRNLIGIDLLETSVSTLPDSFFSFRSDFHFGCKRGQFDPQIEEKITKWIADSKELGFDVKYSAMHLSKKSF